jgi:hypothetical protein
MSAMTNAMWDNLVDKGMNEYLLTASRKELMTLYMHLKSDVSGFMRCFGVLTYIETWWREGKTVRERRSVVSVRLMWFDGGIWSHLLASCPSKCRILSRLQSAINNQGGYEKEVVPVHHQRTCVRVCGRLSTYMVPPEGRKGAESKCPMLCYVSKINILNSLNAAAFFHSTFIYII